VLASIMINRKREVRMIRLWMIKYGRNGERPGGAEGTVTHCSALVTRDGVQPIHGFRANLES